MLLVVLGSCALFHLLAHRLKLPRIMGPLFAGALVGAHSLGWVDAEDSDQLKYITGLFIMFEIGEALHFDALKQVFHSVRQAVLQVVCTIGATILLCKLTLSGLGYVELLILGVILIPSSTPLVKDLLEHFKESKTALSLKTLGVLIFQDAISPLIFIFLVSYAGAKGEMPSLYMVPLSFLSLFAACYGVFVLCKKVVPWAMGDHMDYVGFLLILYALPLAGGAIAEALSLPASLGAFGFGVAVAFTDLRNIAEAEARNDVKVSTVLFFFTLGTYLSVQVLYSECSSVLYWFSIISAVGMTAGTLSALFDKIPFRNALIVGAYLTHTGQFMFLYLNMTVEGGDYFSTSFFQIIVAAGMMTILTTSLWIQLVRYIAFLHAPTVGDTTRLEDDPHAVVIGLGPTGEAAVRVLSETGLKVVVGDRNPLNRSRAMNYGAAEFYLVNVSNSATLNALRLSKARLIVLAIATAGDDMVYTAVRNIRKHSESSELYVTVWDTRLTEDDVPAKMINGLDCARDQLRTAILDTYVA